MDMCIYTIINTRVYACVYHAGIPDIAAPLRSQSDAAATAAAAAVSEVNEKAQSIQHCSDSAKRKREPAVDEGSV